MSRHNGSMPNWRQLGKQRGIRRTDISFGIPFAKPTGRSKHPRPTFFAGAAKYANSPPDRIVERSKVPTKLLCSNTPVESRRLGLGSGHRADHIIGSGDDGRYRWRFLAGQGTRMVSQSAITTATGHLRRRNNGASSEDSPENELIMPRNFVELPSRHTSTEKRRHSSPHWERQSVAPLVIDGPIESGGFAPLSGGPNSQASPRRLRDHGQSGQPRAVAVRVSTLRDLPPVSPNLDYTKRASTPDISGRPETARNSALRHDRHLCDRRFGPERHGTVSWSWPARSTPQQA